MSYWHSQQKGRTVAVYGERRHTQLDGDEDYTAEQIANEFAFLNRSAGGSDSISMTEPELEALAENTSTTSPAPTAPVAPTTLNHVGQSYRPVMPTVLEEASMSPYNYATGPSAAALPSPGSRSSSARSWKQSYPVDVQPRVNAKNQILKSQDVLFNDRYNTNMDALRSRFEDKESAKTSIQRGRVWTPPPAVPWELPKRRPPFKFELGRPDHYERKCFTPQEGSPSQSPTEFLNHMLPLNKPDPQMEHELLALGQMKHLDHSLARRVVILPQIDERQLFGTDAQPARDITDARLPPSNVAYLTRRLIDAARASPQAEPHPSAQRVVDKLPVLDVRSKVDRFDPARRAQYSQQNGEA